MANSSGVGSCPNSSLLHPEGGELLKLDDSTSRKFPGVFSAGLEADLGIVNICFDLSTIVAPFS